MANVKINRHTDIIRRKVHLCGMKDIMFDRYAGDNMTQLEPHQKMYLQPGDELPVIGIPAANITSFLSAHNTNSAPKRLRDKRQYKDIANACLSFLDIEETFIPILRNGEPVRFGGFKNDRDEVSGAYIHRSVARLDKGIPNPKVRPVIPTPAAPASAAARAMPWLRASTIAVYFAQLGGYVALSTAVQRRFYLGGSQTIRGQSALTAAGDAFWMTRAELGTSTALARPIVFIDAGWTGDRRAWHAQGRALSGMGVGASFLDGLVRVDLARGMYPAKQTRLDFYLEARF